jgi:hypothetical protein
MQTLMVKGYSEAAFASGEPCCTQGIMLYDKVVCEVYQYRESLYTKHNSGSRCGFDTHDLSMYKMSKIEIDVWMCNTVWSRVSVSPTALAYIAASSMAESQGTVLQDLVVTAIGTDSIPVASAATLYTCSQSLHCVRQCLMRHQVACSRQHHENEEASLSLAWNTMMYLL